MAFNYRNRKGQTYYLHGRKVQMRNHREQQIYYFAKDAADALDRLPEGYEVTEVTSSALPVLKKAAASKAGA